MKMTEMPKALRDVWSWKASLQRGTARLPIEDAIRTVAARGDASARRLGWAAEAGKSSPLRHVAEARPGYGIKKPPKGPKCQA
jgi:hypothetical protein